MSRALIETDTGRTDPIKANVYADWLEEMGYSEAAVALRNAFPLDNE